MTGKRWILGVLAASSMMTTPVLAQIEWFPANGMSHVRSRNLASASSGTEDRCAYASLNESKSCPWCRQFDRCQQLTLAPGSGASSRDQVRIDALKPPMLDATSRAAYGHGVEFRPDGFRLDARVVTSYENRGTGSFGNRGISSADGEVFLRVPPGAMLDYVMNARMIWDPRTAGGSIQLVGVPNTGADLSAGFGYHAHQLPGGSPASVHHRGRLTPGVYRLIWSIGVDSIGREARQGMAMLAEILVIPTRWPQCTPEGMLPARGEITPGTPRGMTPAPRMTPLPVPFGPGRHDRATRTNPESRLVDINLKGIGEVYKTLKRKQLIDAGLPGNACVVAGHGNPDAVFYENSISVPPEELAKVINRDCWPDEPVVLLACNAGQAKDGGLTPFAQHLSRALRQSGRQNVTVLAPTSYVTVVSPREISLPGDPYIALIGALDSQVLNWWFTGSPVLPDAATDSKPRFIPYVAE